MKAFIRLKLVLLFFYKTVLISQEIPNEFLSFETNKLLTDAGLHWSDNSSFSSPRFNTDKNPLLPQDSISIDLVSGLRTINDDIMVYSFFKTRFWKNFYSYLYPRVVTDSQVFPRYSGKERDIHRLGFKSGEIDLSGVGYQNKWALVQFGRGRQSWGVGNGIQLTLSDNSNAYDYGMLALDFGKFRSRYIHGWLENRDSTNRYLTGKGFEWTNRKNLIISLSEVIIYSGPQRAFDLSYLNPLSSHLEVELNDRQNVLGTGSANAIWQISLDYLFKNLIRVSGNVIIDELILDRIEKDNGKENGVGFSLRTVWTPIRDKNIVSLFLSIAQIGTHTLKHENGNNNFVHRGDPLGWIHGNDAKELRLGLNYIKYPNFIFTTEIGRRDFGENSIIISPYQMNYDHQSGPFPSGIITTLHFFNARMRKKISNNMFFICQLNWEKSNIGSENVKVDFQIDYSRSYKKNFSINNQ